MTIEKYEIKTEQDFSKLKNVWNQLETGENMTLFQGFEWNRLLVKEWIGWKLHRMYSRVFVYIALNGSSAVMLMPVIVYKFSTRTKWFGNPKGVYLLGQSSYSDYMDAVYTQFDAKAFEKIRDEIQSDFKGFRICLTSVREDSPLAVYLMKKGVDCQEFTVTVSVKRKASVEEYQDSLDRKIRENLRRSLNRMERDNIVYRLEILGPIQDQALLNELVQIHVKRILVKNTKDAGILHILSSYVRKSYRKYRDIHNNIIAMSMKENKKSMVILFRMNGEIAGYEYCVRDGNVIRMLQTCFDDKFKFYSPGFRGIYDYILQCYEDPTIQEFDFTRGNEGYKRQLGGEEKKLYEFAL